MTRNVKWRITAIVLLLMAVTNGMAQMSKEFLNATYEARNKITISDPVSETNTLSLDANLYKFSSKTGKATVAALLRPGDYSKYYKGNLNADLTRVKLWVFEPTHTKAKFQTKVPNVANRTWQRFCQFLGLDATEYNPIENINSILLERIGIRDTIVYLEVDRNKLFRPAYETDITKAVTKTASCTFVCTATTKSAILSWIADQQYHNIYPWTRLGYTYDWGDPADHFGATEFILESGTYPIKKSPSTPTRDYDTVADFSR